MVVLALAAVFVAVAGWETLWNRLQLPDPLAGRREILWSSLDMIRTSPAWGFGLGALPAVYPQFARFDDGACDRDILGAGRRIAGWMIVSDHDRRGVEPHRIVHVHGDLLVGQFLAQDARAAAGAQHHRLRRLRRHD